MQSIHSYPFIMRAGRGKRGEGEAGGEDNVAEVADDTAMGDLMTEGGFNGVLKLRGLLQPCHIWPLSSQRHMQCQLQSVSPTEEDSRRSSSLRREIQLFPPVKPNSHIIFRDQKQIGSITSFGRFSTRFRKFCQVFKVSRCKNFCGCQISF